MKTDLSPDTDVSLLPRADLPVIWDAFKAKAELVRATAETLTVTRIDQKEEMALARTTRLTLREIRIAVEKKRVELGESHLKEIKKVNGAATAIKEFIEPLEARLLTQEGFAERHEANRIAELSKSRLAELKEIRVCLYPTDLGTMKQEEYDGYVARLRSEKVEIEAANRLRVEAESRLAEAQAEAQRVAEVTRATLELAQRVALEVKQKSDAEVERQRKETAAILNAKLAAAQAEAKAEREQAELLRHKEYVKEQARLDAELAVRNADFAEQKRIRDEQYAKLEAELAQANAAKLAEERRLHALAVAPDKEQLRAFHDSIYQVPQPDLKTPEGVAILNRVQCKIAEAFLIIDVFCAE